MKVYNAGIYLSGIHKGSNYYNLLNDREKAAVDSVAHILESFYYINSARMLSKIRENKSTVFLDSGAFTAFTKKVDISVNEYCDFIKRNEDIIEKVGGTLYASVLDGIGDPLLTYQNQVEMERQGVIPLPCFHYGEDERYLEYYIENYDYITLGGMVPISNKQLYYWLDRIWHEYLTNEDGSPKLKVHGFGLTVLPMMLRYPWYSVDSSSWVMSAAMGSIIVPGYKTIAISARSPSIKNQDQHFDTLPREEQALVIESLESAGFEYERMRELNYSRWAYNAWSLPEQYKLAAEKAEETFIPDQYLLF